jgi:cytochrome c oxidase subunit 2
LKLITPRWSGWLPHCVLLTLFGTASVAVAQTPGPETTGDRVWWLPENVFPAAEHIDLLFNFILYMTGAVCIGVFAVMIAFLIKYRHKPGRHSAFIHGNTRLEIVWTLIPTIIMALTAVFSQATWTAIKRQPVVEAGEDVVRIEVVARQFQWFFHYPGADGAMGPRRMLLIDPQSSEPDSLIGLDRDHPDAGDDIVAPYMSVPVNTKVMIQLSSVDVLHSFFLPNFRIKQDAVPGLNGKMWLEATKTSAQVIGTSPDEPAIFDYAKPFDIVCAELCGQGHFKMRGKLYVVSRDQYEAFLEEEASYLDTGGDDEDYY